MQQTFATPRNDKSNPYSTVNAAPKGQFCKPYSPQELSNGTMRLDLLKAQAG